MDDAIRQRAIEALRVAMSAWCEAQGPALRAIAGDVLDAIEAAGLRFVDAREHDAEREEIANLRAQPRQSIDALAAGPTIEVLSGPPEGPCPECHAISHKMDCSHGRAGRLTAPARSR